MIKLVLDRAIFEYDGRGIAKVTNALYKELMKRHGSEIDLFCLCHNPLVMNLDFPYKEIRCPNSNWDEVWGYKFADAVNSIGADIVHFPFNGNFSKRWIELKGKTKIIATIHDMIPFALPEMHHISPEWLVERRKDVQYFCDIASLILTVSYSAKQDIQNDVHIIPEKVKVLYNAGFLKDVLQEPPPVSDYFLYNGGYDYRKGLLEMVDNFLRLKMAGKLQSKLVMTGKVQPLSARFSALIRYGVEQGWIIDLGYVSDPQLAGLFVHAKAAIYLSAYEGFGLPPLEAMSLGCPVITCHNSSITEVCGESVCYVDRNHDREVQNALLRMENDFAYRDYLIAAGKVQSQKFSWERSAEQFFFELKQLTNKTNRKDSAK